MRHCVRLSSPVESFAPVLHKPRICRAQSPVCRVVLGRFVTSLQSSPLNHPNGMRKRWRFSRGGGMRLIMVYYEYPKLKLLRSPLQRLSQCPRTSRLPCSGEGVRALILFSRHEDGFPNGNARTMSVASGTTVSNKKASGLWSAVDASCTASMRKL